MDIDSFSKYLGGRTGSFCTMGVAWQKVSVACSRSSGCVLFFYGRPA
jgi:hypothetical protein